MRLAPSAGSAAAQACGGPYIRLSTTDIRLVTKHALCLFDAATKSLAVTLKSDTGAMHVNMHRLCSILDRIMQLLRMIAGKLRAAAGLRRLVVFSFFSMGQHAFICVSSEVATFWRRMDMRSLLLLHTTMSFFNCILPWGWLGAITLTSLCGIVAAAGAQWIHTHIIVNGIPVPRNRLVVFVALTTLSYYIPMWQRGIKVAISTHTVFPDLIAPPHIGAVWTHCVPWLLRSTLAARPCWCCTTCQAQGPRGA